MNETVNVGIDLGTTKSILAVFENGSVTIRRHNLTHKDTLPSAVWVKKDKIVVGDKAFGEAFGPSSQDIAFAFKRKMGTAERFRFRSTNTVYSPIDLSALVLKELRERHFDNAVLDAAVITVPASFDLRQSSATVEAGKKAGIKQVITLQEPIAASLAYANTVTKEKLPDKPWLVYDLGGGTFDAAIVCVDKGELNVIDHEGDNYLGGYDVDRQIVENFIFPCLKGNFGVTDSAEFTSERGRYQRFFGRFMSKAESAKIELSTRQSAELEDLEFGSDHLPDVFSLIITRSEFESCLRSWVDKTIDLVKRLLTRKQLRPSDLSFVVMVGGSTKIPYVRQRIGQALGIEVRTDIDPITAIAVGAAYFAATRVKDTSETPSTGYISEPQLALKLAYQRMSLEKEEIIAVKVQGDTHGLSYRIERMDGGFDSGLKPLTQRFMEDVPLVLDSFNIFRIRIMDEEGHPVLADAEEFAIAHGKVAAIGQPCTADISLEVDHPDKDTFLCPVFKKGIILPAKRMIPLESSKVLAFGSSDKLLFNVREGDANSPPEACKMVGRLEIAGTDLKKSIRKGSPIKCWVSLSESRELSIDVEIDETTQTFVRTFKQQDRFVDPKNLFDVSSQLDERITEAIETANSEEAYERSQQLQILQRRAAIVGDEARVMREDDLTDRKYLLEDQLHAVLADLDCIESPIQTKRLMGRLQKALDMAEESVRADGNDLDRRRLEDAKQQAVSARRENSPQAFDKAAEQIEAIHYEILWRTPRFLEATFLDLSQNYYSRFNDTGMADAYIQSGKQALTAGDWMRLRDVTISLIHLLPSSEHDIFLNRTGIRLSSG